MANRASCGEEPDWRPCSSTALAADGSVVEQQSPHAHPRWAETGHVSISRYSKHLWIRQGVSQPGGLAGRGGGEGVGDSGGGCGM
eukprot:4425613-Prymnesium_polylepis.2